MARGPWARGPPAPPVRPWLVAAVIVAAAVAAAADDVAVAVDVAVVAVAVQILIARPRWRSFARGPPTVTSLHGGASQSAAPSARAAASGPRAPRLARLASVARQARHWRLRALRARRTWHAWRGRRTRPRSAPAALGTAARTRHFNCMWRRWPTWRARRTGRAWRTVRLGCLSHLACLSHVAHLALPRALIDFRTCDARSALGFAPGALGTPGPRGAFRAPGARGASGARQPPPRARGPSSRRAGLAGGRGGGAPRYVGRVAAARPRRRRFGAPASRFSSCELVAK